MKIITNLFKTKKITIPVDNAQEVTELESWTVKWVFSDYWNREITKFKSFINEKDCNEFIKQLKESALFIGMQLNVSKYKN